MFKKTVSLSGLLFVSILGWVVAGHAQGNLTPSGAPAPTMKTLQQIEPRVDVATVPAGASAHHNITNPGSYFLSANLAVTNSIGINVVAAGVTLDLNGFEIARTGGSGGDGIRINTNAHRVTVRNGTLRGFEFGINGSLNPHAKGGLFEQLAATGCTGYGIFVGDYSRVLDCRAYDNAGSGIVAYQGSVITGCIAHGNRGTYGIYGGLGSTISGCAAYGNVGTGSPSYGIYSPGDSTIIGCTSRDNSNTNSPATNSPAIGSEGGGIFTSTGSTVQDCTVTDNRGDGIRVSSSCLIKGNNCHNNGNGGDGAGIHTTGTRNRIEANTVTSNDRGIDVDSGANFIIRNNASFNLTNYVIATNNVFGAIVNRTAPASAAVNGSSAASSAATTDPWANFSH